MASDDEDEMESYRSVVSTPKKAKKANSFHTTSIVPTDQVNMSKPFFHVFKELIRLAQTDSQELQSSREKLGSPYFNKIHR